MNETAAAPTHCMRCRSIIADPSTTGFICESCQGSSQPDDLPGEGWRRHVPSAAIPGAIASVVGFVFSASYFYDGRGLDIVAFVCGGIAVTSGIAGTVQGLRSGSRRYGAALAVVAVGLFHLVWRSAVLTLL